MAAIEDQLLRALSGFPEIRLALLFGSRASGRPRADSDIDLAILADSPLAPERRACIIEAVALATGCPIDLVDLYHAPEPVLGEALKGVRLLGNAAAHRPSTKTVSVSGSGSTLNAPNSRPSPGNVSTISTKASTNQWPQP